MSALLAQWLLNEGSGTTAAASVGSSINMTLTGGSPAVAWNAGAGAGKEVTYDGSLPARLETPIIPGTVLEVDIHGSDKSQLTFETVYSCTGSGGQTIFSMSDGGATGIEFLWVPGSFYRLQILRCGPGGSSPGNNLGTWQHNTAPASLTRAVIHAVIDLTASTVTVYVNGTALSTTSIDGSGAHINGLDNTGLTLCLNDRSDNGPGDNPCTGAHAYFAIYDGALTSGECAANATALAANNDADPGAGASGVTIPTYSSYITA